jgi:hypothetical protein
LAAPVRLSDSGDYRQSDCELVINQSNGRPQRAAKLFGQ